jgi:hypothetical protein
VREAGTAGGVQRGSTVVCMDVALLQGSGHLLVLFASRGLDPSVHGALGAVG